MKTKRLLFTIVSMVIVASMSLAACTPAATATTAPVTAAATTAPVAPTTAPVAAPTTAVAAPTTAPAATTAPAQPAGPTKGGKIVVSDAAGNYYTLDEFVSPWHDYADYAMYDTLLATKLDFSGYVGDLVTDQWEVSSDNLTVTFHVRPGLKFQDGTAVDAPALKWNLDHWIDPKVAAPAGGNLQGALKSVDAPDASTLVLHLLAPYAPLYNELASVEMSSPTAYQALGSDKFALAPVGAGPWQKPVIAPNDSYIYSRNDAYNWAPNYFTNKGPVYPDQLEVKFVADDQSAFAALQTGEINVLASIPSQFLDQAKADSKITIVQGAETGGDYLGFNTQYPPFNNPQVRIAISYAINRDEVIQAAVSGAGVPMYSNLSSAEIGFSQTAEDYGKSKSDNVDTAKQMLATLGYKAGSDGILVGKDGKRMEFKLSCTPTDETKRIAEDIQAQLKDIGVQADIDIKDSDTIKSMTQAGTHQMIIWSYGMLDPNILTYLFSSDRIGKSNRTRFNSPDLDKMLKDADTTMDYTTRMQKVNAILT
ncbi:MAG: ABC transporter substrate-binding protein, partial [Anaerolineaceae bacterium]|nr:ABC transporter substrate-binding protein [Anaerolineaceae bacterium]